jgi:hypothetical protein
VVLDQRRKSKTLTVAPARTHLVAGRSSTLAVKLSRAALQALEQGARESIVFTLTATGANGVYRTSVTIGQIKLAGR